MSASNVKIPVLVAAAGLLAVVVFVVWDFNGDIGPVVAVANSEPGLDAQQMNTPLHFNNGRGGRDGNGSNFDTANSLPQADGKTGSNENPPVEDSKEGGSLPLDSDSQWISIDELPNLEHALFTFPRWNQDTLPSTAPADHHDQGYNFAESARWRVETREQYDPRTTFDAAVRIDVLFYGDAPNTAQSQIPLDWVEVRSSRSGRGWMFSPRRRDGSGYSSVGITVPFEKRDVLVVRARRTDGVVGEALVTDMGLGRGNYEERRSVNSSGTVEVLLEPLDTLDSFYSCILNVADASDTPLEGAVVLYGSQILGRTDSAGVAQVRVPGIRHRDDETPTSSRNYISIWNAGYAPFFFSRAELANMSWDVRVRLAAKEMLAGAPVHMDPAYLVRDFASGIMQSGNDLLPLADDVSGSTWENTVAPWLSGTDGNKVKGAFVSPALAFGGKQPGAYGMRGYAVGLERAMGIKRRDHWPYTYGQWYHNRWVYEDGVITASLPHAGKFLLLLGEGTDAGVDASTLTHALFIDARDPERVTGKLLVRPGY